MTKIWEVVFGDNIVSYNVEAQTAEGAIYKAYREAKASRDPPYAKKHVTSVRLIASV